MERRYLKNMVDWLKSPIRQPLMVYGARQVGKTYLIRDLFAQSYFKRNFFYFDLSNDFEFKDFCYSYPNDKAILDYISLRNNGVQLNSSTLLIFDEVQECLPLISLMKQFAQNHPDIPIIETGSMVRIKMKRSVRRISQKEFLFPVGKIDTLHVYPLDFGEYLSNKNPALFNDVKESYRSKTALDSWKHDIALSVFYEYLLIGGMPRVVDTFLKYKKFGLALSVLHSIYDDYLSDMSLYQASGESYARSVSVFNNIYSQLNKESKNFKASFIDGATRQRDLFAPIDWLTLASLVIKNRILKERITLPLRSVDDTIYRLYLSDMGIFTKQSKADATSFIDKNTRNALSGIFFENYVAIELNNHGFPLFYWKGKGEAEFEFLIEHKGKVIPIKVKKGRGKINSLNKFATVNPDYEYCLKVSPHPYGYDPEKRILNIPFYDFFLFAEEIEKDENPEDL